MVVKINAGTAGRARTDMRLPSRDFESRVSTNSTTAACEQPNKTWLQLEIERKKIIIKVP